MPFERIEVAIAVEQLIATHNAAGCKHNVHRSAHGQAKTAKLSIVHGSLDSYITATEHNKLQTTKKPARHIEFLLKLAALQNLGQVQVTNSERLRIKKNFKALCLPRRLAPKVVNPNARIDKNHLSRLMASRSPSHVTLPRSLRISAWPRSWRRVFNPSSTTSRFVRRPVARRVSAMSLSSITMLVLIVCIKVVQATHCTRHRTAAQLPCRRLTLCRDFRSLVGPSTRPVQPGWSTQ